MATAKKNPVMGGGAAAWGSWYLSSMVICKWPEHDPNRQPTAGEIRQRGG